MAVEVAVANCLAASDAPQSAAGNVGGAAAVAAAD